MLRMGGIFPLLFSFLKKTFWRRLLAGKMADVSAAEEWIGRENELCGGGGGVGWSLLGGLGLRRGR